MRAIDADSLHLAPLVVLDVLANIMSSDSKDGYVA